MQADTHIAGGALAGTGMILSVAQGHLPDNLGLLTFTLPLIAVVGSLFPDIDLGTSKMGRAAGILSKAINFLVGHRTLFHGLILYGTFYYYIATQQANLQPYVLAFLLGVISHLFLDMFNSQGVPLLYPVPYRFHLANIKVGSVFEKLIKNFCIAISLIFVYCTIAEIAL